MKFHQLNIDDLSNLKLTSVMFFFIYTFLIRKKKLLIDEIFYETKYVVLIHIDLMLRSEKNSTVNVWEY